MNAESAKTELRMSHFRHALDQLSGHYAEVGDVSVSVFDRSAQQKREGVDFKRFCASLVLQAHL